MNKPSLSPDDLPPDRATQQDEILRRQLEESTSKHFYDACERSIQNLLSNCDWYVTANASAITLVIICPNRENNWRVLQNVVAIGTPLKQIAKSAKIRICPPIGTETPFVIRVDELSVYP